MSSSNCCFLTFIQVSQEAGQVVCYSHLLKNFPQFIVIHTVKGFGIVNKAEIDVFLELSCLFYDPADVGNLISGSSVFSKTSSNIWKFTVDVLLKPGFIPIPKKGNAKECSNYHTIALISHASKVMLKILQARLQNMWTMNFLMFKLVLEKAEEPEIKLPTSAGSWKNQESSRKTTISALLTMPKSLTVWITINCGKFFKRWE